MSTRRAARVLQLSELPSTDRQVPQWIERELTNGKADQRHNPSIKSCLFRLPWTINTKARAAGKDPFVRVVQGKYPYSMMMGYDGGDAVLGSSSRPTNAFLNKFLASLIQEVIDSKVEKLDRRRRSLTFRNMNDHASKGSIFWVDKLLQTPVDDNRKNLIFWVLAPYLITVRGLDYDRSYHIIESWLDKCDNVRSLEPGWDAFRYRIRYCLEAAEDQERKPIRFETFKEYYPELYKKLSITSGGGIKN